MVERFWVDLGNQKAVDASLIHEIEVMPPWPISMIGIRAFVEQLSWCVAVTESLGMTSRVVAHYPDEEGARRHARKIVRQMLDAAGV